jgi:transcriptional regulator with XRE-family HTH domain
LPFCYVRLKGQVEKRHSADYPRILNTLGDHLQKRCLDLGLQWKKVASQIGASATNVALWRKQQTAPGLRFWPDIIKFLGYDLRPQVDTLAERLKKHRTGLGLSRVSAARQIGVDPSTLARWEMCCGQPVGKYLAKVYSFLGEDPRPVPVTIAERLKCWREAVGWSQRELARRIGVYPSTVERWELGQREPRLESVRRLERLFTGSGM